MICHQRTVRETSGREPFAADTTDPKFVRIETLSNGASSWFTFGRVPIEIGRHFIEKYEWLGHAGRALIFYGIWKHGEVYGVEAFTPPPYGLAKSLSETGKKTLQLSRGATCLAAGKDAGSMIVGACLRDLRRRGYQLIVAFADKRAGEAGVVYRAANATYGGVSDSKRTYYLYEGKWITDHTLWRSYKKRVSELPVNTPRKHDEEPKLRFFWKLYRKAYIPDTWKGNVLPKRILSADDDIWSDP